MRYRHGGAGRERGNSHAQQRCPDSDHPDIMPLGRVDADRSLFDHGRGMVSSPDRPVYC